MSQETDYILTMSGQTVRNDIPFVEAYKNPASTEFQALDSETCGAVSTKHLHSFSSNHFFTFLVKFCWET